MFYDNTVIVMSLEIIVQSGIAPHAGKTICPRYTNIWMKKINKWLLTARHANVICSN